MITWVALLVTWGPNCGNMGGTIVVTWVALFCGNMGGTIR